MEREFKCRKLNEGMDPRVVDYGGLAACVKEMSAEIRRGDG
jgi:hypothetical protein